MTNWKENENRNDCRSLQARKARCLYRPPVEVGQSVRDRQGRLTRAGGSEIQAMAARPAATAGRAARAEGENTRLLVLARSVPRRRPRGACGQAIRHTRSPPACGGFHLRHAHSPAKRSVLQPKCKLTPLTFPPVAFAQKSGFREHGFHALAVCRRTR